MNTTHTFDSLSPKAESTTATSRLLFGSPALLLFLSSVIFTALFYESYGMGMNAAFFTLFLSVYTFFAEYHTKVLSFRVLPALGVITAVAIAWRGTDLSVLASIAVLIFLAGKLSDQKLAAWESALIIGTNVLLSPFSLFIRTLRRLTNLDGKYNRRALHWILPVLFLLVLTALYANASPIFNNLIQKLVVADFAECTLLFLLGLLLTLSFNHSICPEFISKMIRDDGSKSEEAINRSPIMPWAIAIFGANLLLGLVVASDAYYRIVLHNLPSSLTLSEYLHQGVYSLIFSVMLATVFSLIALKHRQIRQNKALFTMSITFLVLNLLFIAQTVARNLSYVNHYGLTELRVLVFAYLLVCSAAIILTFRNVAVHERALTLYRQTGWVVIGLLVFCSLFNWSTIITRYNLSHLPTTTENPDYSYLLSLNDSNLPLLLPHIANMNGSDRIWLDNKLSGYYNFLKEHNGPDLDVRTFVVDHYLTEQYMDAYLNHHSN